MKTRHEDKGICLKCRKPLIATTCMTCGGRCYHRHLLISKHLCARCMGTGKEYRLRINPSSDGTFKRNAIESAAALLVSGTGTTIVSSSIVHGPPSGPVLRPATYVSYRHYASVERAGHVGEVDPLEEAMGPPRARCKLLESPVSPSITVAAWPGNSDLILSGEKPRLTSATLSLAAANSGPSRSRS